MCPLVWLDRARRWLPIRWSCVRALPQDIYAVYCLLSSQNKLNLLSWLIAYLCNNWSWHHQHFKIMCNTLLAIFLIANEDTSSISSLFTFHSLEVSSCARLTFRRKHLVYGWISIRHESHILAKWKQHGVKLTTLCSVIVHLTEAITGENSRDLHVNNYSNVAHN